MVESVDREVDGGEFVLRVWKCRRTTCGHEWANRNGRKPRICPACKSTEWEYGDGE